MLQEYWASTVIFIGIFFQCNNRKYDRIVIYENQWECDT